MFIVTKKIDSENITKLCRTCLREDGEKMVCLFAGPAGSSLAAKLRTLSCLEVWQGDGLPEKLCDRCVTRAESALLYREQCRAADLALRQAASKVSQSALDATLSNSTLYTHQKSHISLLANSQKSLRCADCEALFSTYQELCVHSRMHLPFRENRPVQHMNIVESQNSLGYMNPLHGQMEKNPGIMGNSFAGSSVAETLSLAKNDRASCALHCSLCNHTFTNRTQLINHHAPTHEDPETSCDETTLEAINYSSQIIEESRNIVNNDDGTDGTSLNQENSNDSSDSSIDSCNEIPRFPMTFDEYPTTNNAFANDATNLRKKIHKCALCDKSFAQRSKLRSHELLHSGEKPYACENCDKAYTSKSKLNAHARLHSMENVHRCEICEKTFTHLSYLKEHKKIHDKMAKNSRTRDHSCHVCNKQFRLLKNLKTHLRLHNGKGLVRCEICHKVFSQKYNLKVHLRTHGVVGKFLKCNYCGKSFAARGNFLEHLRIHTKVKPFECRLCDKSFSQSSHLKTHEITHNSTRPHQCRLCGKRFKLAAHLRRHAATHSSVKSYKCEQCDQMFSQAFSLKRHLKRHNEAQI